jgi:hypothetical protein
MDMHAASFELQSINYLLHLFARHRFPFPSQYFGSIFCGIPDIQVVVNAEHA